MIYTLGCSMTKWRWPTWVDWLRVYSQEPVTNWAYTGYCNNQMYWLLLDRLDQIKVDDQVIIMWPRNDRIIQWYDKEWIDEYDCKGFFPDTQGKLWFGNDTPYLGMYRTHPDHMNSLTHMIINGFACILQTQQLLNSIGCRYLMSYSQNPWFDGRPTYKPTFEIKWNSKDQFTSREKETANQLLSLRPFQNILKQIDWSKFIDAPTDLNNPEQYPGIWEYYIAKKEYVIYKHDTDNHPVSLAHHDFALEKILKIDPHHGQHRKLSEQISKDSMSIDIPPLSDTEFIADPEMQLLPDNIKIILENI